MKQTIRSKHIVTHEGIRAGVIRIEDQRIGSIESYDYSEAAGEQIDAADLFVLPGLIDSHVHINEPGRTAWEGFETATRAGAAGGYTCLIDMPLNCIPSTATVDALQKKRDTFRGKAHTDLAFWGAVVPGNVDEIIPLAREGVRGFKCFLTHPGTDEFEMVTKADLRRAMPKVAETGLPLLAHAEVPGPMIDASAALDATGADWTRYATYLQSRPEEAELEAIRILIDLCREYRCRTHIVHLSAAAALHELEDARRERLPVTVETCPHYLFFDAESIPDRATQFKCAPPIRGSSNRDALWQGLRDRTIDLIATDHSPCPPEMKCFNVGSFRSAWGGISSLSVSLPAVWTEASRRGFVITDVVRWMSEAPARLAGIDSRKGRIAAGFDADLVLFDPNAEFTVDAGRLHFRHPFTPYAGKRLRGKVKSVMLRGSICFAEGRFQGCPGGVEVFTCPG
ncbi:MAG: allantoinase AllB [Acidobacteriaceae bacterium]|nr:allantoinase AllB [Acidobacteriaceae bacterium]MBV8571728.1 allantoinase AllB [Acidobacteriaceae bacterium]